MSTSSNILTLSSKTGGDITAAFGDPIKLDRENFNYSLALHGAYLWYSWANISPEFGNNTIVYNNGVTDKTILFPAGNYSVADIIAQINVVLKANGDSTIVDGTDTFDINLSINYSTIQVTVTLTNGYTLDLSGSTFGELLGFPAVNLTTTTTSTLTPDIPRGIDSIFINCSMIKGSYSNGIRDQVLYSFSPNTAPGTLIHVNPRNLVFLDIDVDMISSIRIYVTDQLQRALDFRNEGSTFMLELRQTPKIQPVRQ
jgi:hypothetical protein